MTVCFTKENTSGFKNALIIEARGLELLRSTLVSSGIQELKVPEVQSVNEQTLTIERILSSTAFPSQMAQFGRGLAKLHKVEQTAFGLAYDNYIGLNPQKNEVTDNWGQFFVDLRLGYQISLIRQASVREAFQSTLEQVKEPLIAYLNEHCAHPSLVHGDLWSGNALFDQTDCWLIDPAAYVADREVDLAMTELFGGFSTEFYQAYDTEYSRTKAYASKKVIYNLYHYLNHYNLFGGSYLSDCRHGFEWLELTF